MDGSARHLETCFFLTISLPARRRVVVFSSAAKNQTLPKVLQTDVTKGEDWHTP
jgi:hypothetical protein